MSTDFDKRFMLGACEIRPAEHCIIRAGDKHHVEPKSMAVLLELAVNSTDLVNRDDLISKVWPRGFVTDDVLNRCISQLRSALGDDPKSPTYIATVPRMGYRLVAQVVMHNEPEVDGILVLPFQNLAAHGKDEYLADGLTELLIARLAVAMDQRVISRTTAMSYKGDDAKMSDMRDQLRVQWIIEGSLLQLGSQLQVVVQLIDTHADAHAWAEAWTRPSEDIMAVLNEITRQITTQINARLMGPTTEQAEAVTLPDELLRRYLQGMHHASKRAVPSLRQAMICFGDVLADHADHAPALAGMAMCHLLLVHYGADPAPQGIPLARDFAERALEIDSKNADAMSHLGAINFFYDWDFEKAGELAHAALDLKPNQEMALILAANVNLINRHYEKSQAQVDKAIMLDPLNVGILMNAGDVLILQRRYGEAINSLVQALELEPQLRPACLRLGLAYALNGQHNEAIETMLIALKLGGDDALYHEYMALIYGQAGDLEKACAESEILLKMANIGERVLPWSLARAWAASGNDERAIIYLNQALESRSSSVPFLGQSPMFQSVRQYPEVQKLMALAGLPS